MSSLESTLADAVLEPILLVVKTSKTKVGIFTWDSERAKIAEMKGELLDALPICEEAICQQFVKGNEHLRPILRTTGVQVLGLSKSISEWVFDHDSPESEQNGFLLNFSIESEPSIVFPPN
tara:strand:- start:14 stop:376 length:363 start_codon:yes stop_codon:yes gene_type:complete